MAKLINIKIEGHPYQVEEGLTILEAARKCGYEIPSLCTFNKGECSLASCRVWLVEATVCAVPFVTAVRISLVCACKF